MNYLVRILNSDDAAAVDAFLEPHTPFAYFMRSNARHGGLVYQGKPYQAEFFGGFDGDRLVGILAHTWIASVQVFSTQAAAIPALAAAWQRHLVKNPRAIDCFIGPGEQVRAVEQAVGVTPETLRGDDAEERLYALALDRLSFPQIRERELLRVRRAQAGDGDTLIRWRHDFNVEAKGDKPGQENYDCAREEIMRRIGEGDLFVLEREGALVNFCGAGGFLSDWKVVGPVWTPPDLRARGYGRAVTAGALLQLREEGSAHAVLFARDPCAERAYRAIGFDVIGDWRLDFRVNRHTPL